MRLALDHLVIAARTLGDGMDWCDATLGLRPTAGGQHLFMGTHNRVFDVSSPRFPRSYVEIIAVDPSLPAPAHPRWFDLDDSAQQQQLARGPQLVHWVARVDDGDIGTVCAAMLRAGVDCGDVMSAERGTLRWRITVRADGRRALAGASPALIEWADAHPTDALTASGVRLEALHVAAPALSELLPAAIRGDAVPPLVAVLATPRGTVTLATPLMKA
jgi:hypothetical protein